MEEKERYIYHEVSSEVEQYECYYDTEDCCELFNDEDVLNRLNQQDNRIKELEQGLKTREGRINILDERKKVLLKLIGKLYKELFPDGREVTNETCVDVAISQIKENQQLKQELQEERAELKQLYSHLEVETFGEDIQEQAVKEIDKIKEESQQLKQQLEEWQDGTIICKWTDAENKVKELNQQLAITEKALELACDYLVSNENEYDELYKLVQNIYNDDEYLTTKINYFKTKAKEMLKSE